MAGLIPPNQSSQNFGRRAAIAALSILGACSLQSSLMAQADLFQQAVNYVFTGKINPDDGPKIVDRESCIVVMRDPNFERYIRYYLGRFNMDDALFDRKYSGRSAYYELSVKGDDVVIEYLNLDKKTVAQGYRSAHISLPGDIDQTRKALRIIFDDHCKAEAPKTPF